MNLKQGVKLTGMTPQILLAMMVMNEVYHLYGQELVVTSVNDSKHGKGSKHYNGNGFDARTSYFTPDTAQVIVNQLKARLDESFDIVLEKDHIHVEYDPTYEPK